MHATLRTSHPFVTLLTVGGLLSFFIFGFIDNMKGALLPELLRAQGFDYGQGGQLLLAAYLGFVVATLVTGVLADCVGNRCVLLAAGVLLLVGLLSLSVVAETIGMVLAMGIVGLGLGAIEVGANGLMLELHPGAPGRYLNLLATFHGVGSLLVPIYVALLLSIGMSWQGIYASGLALTVPLLIVFSIPVNHARGEHAEATVGKKESEQQSLNELSRAWFWHSAFQPKMLCYYVLIGCYVATELGVAAWIVEYMQKVVHLGVSSSSVMLSAFFAMIMIGRLVGALLVDRIAYTPAIALALVGGVACLSVGLIWPQAAFGLLPVSGLFFSIVFPTVTAQVLSQHARGRGTIMGILFTFGGIGGAVGPWLIGQFAMYGGLRAGLALTVLFGALALAMLVIIAVCWRPAESRIAA